MLNLIWQIVFFTSLLVASSLIGQQAITVEDIWKEHKFFPSGIEGFRSTNDGAHFTRFAIVNGSRSIMKYSFENRGGAGELLFSSKQLVENKINGKLSDYDFNKTEDQLLLMTDKEKRYRRSYFANYYIYDINTKKIQPLDEDRVPQTLAEFSPDGKKVAYVHENNLYVKDLETGKIQAITTDGAINKIINGTTDWVYEEEFAITKGFEWSHDSKLIAFLKFNETYVKDFTMTYYEELYPRLYTYKYPKAGEDNSFVTMNLYHLVNDITIQVPFDSEEYLPRFKWSPKTNQLVVLTLNRHQNHLKYHLIDTRNNNFSLNLIYQEKDPAYIDIDDNLIFVEDGNAILRTSEKDGYNHIYLLGLDGKQTQITKGDFDVIDFKGVDERNNLIYYTSAERGAIYKDVYSIQLNGKKKRRLTEKAGFNDATFSEGMKYYVHSWSDANTPPVYTLMKANGQSIEVLEDNEILQFLMKEYGFVKKEFMEIQGAETNLNAWMIKPPGFDPSIKYPVYFDIYAGPGSNKVNDAFESANLAYHQLLAQKGYIVFCVDPRGTMRRGAAFKKSTYLQLGKLETDDLLAVAHELCKLGYVDEERLGIMGWSYGGYMSSLVMTKGEGLFKMGIAVAPVTNWRFYDNIYTERFMRTPQENASGYDDNSPINFVDQLKGKYLLIHGTGDDNVHVQNTYEMVKALVKADKQFDLFIYPNKDHGIYGGNTRNHLFKMMLDYTLENL